MSEQNVVIAIQASFGISSPPRSDRWANSMLHFDPLQLNLYIPCEGAKGSIWIIPYAWYRRPDTSLMFSAYAHKDREALVNAALTIRSWHEEICMPNLTELVQLVSGMASYHVGNGGHVAPDEHPLILQQ